MSEELTLGLRRSDDVSRKYPILFLFSHLAFSLLAKA